MIEAGLIGYAIIFFVVSLSILSKTISRYECAKHINMDLKNELDNIVACEKKLAHTNYR